ncbi:hypothetical protein QE177_14820 (plasmid) [Arsenophonus sp. aPb]|uniref:hypothetical protein n=1 Tax=Arsenophonus sp. aPb TaxID=3041619 RepID=UPI0024694BA8|nr:hypothetical protein [Arsenophonus sp. aPb]WGL99784.1 hypothetical protein QE177_14820 [Arsenophonus sp. aPb]
MRIILLFAFIFYTISYTTSTFAGCYASGDTITINSENITVNENTPIGTELATFMATPSKTYNCDNNQTSYMTVGGKAYGEFASNINGTRVYKTNIEGIGYSLGAQAMCDDGRFASNGWKNNPDQFSICTNNSTWNNITHNFAVKIYKIGPTGSGLVTRKQVGASILAYNNENYLANENPVFLNSFRVTTISSWGSSNNNNNNNSGWSSNNNNNNNNGGWGSNNNNNNNGGWGSNNNNNNNGGWGSNNNNNNNN